MVGPKLSVTDGLDVIGLILLAVGLAWLVSAAVGGNLGTGLGIITAAAIVLAGSQLIAHLQAPRRPPGKDDDQ